VLLMVKQQRALAHMGKCVAVCNELVACNLDENSWRLSMYCAFQADGGEGVCWRPGPQADAARLPYISWLVKQLMTKMR
jgi:hypothetical protein